MQPRKLLLRNRQSPGDILMLTAAVRDLHLCYPGLFETAVETSAAYLWDNNPYLVPPDPADSFEIVDCHYPLISKSNQHSLHFLNGFIDFLNSALNLNVELTRMQADLHLSEEERCWPGELSAISNLPFPYWIVVAGGKYDFTIKWWDPNRFQAVVDALKDRIVFIQVGSLDHFHPPLKGVLDFRGKTEGRKLLSLVHHASGVLCPVTFMMHLAAAVERSDETSGPRPCVCIAGGREPVSWERYPDHRFLHTVGELECCRGGGCWRSRTLPLGDGDPKDSATQLCVDVVGALPRCMDRISVDQVVKEIESSLPSDEAVSCTRQGQSWAATALTHDPMEDLLERERGQFQ